MKTGHIVWTCHSKKHKAANNQESKGSEAGTHHLVAM